MRPSRPGSWRWRAEGVFLALWVVVLGPMAEEVERRVLAWMRGGR